jgi:hypothetical protein
MTRTAILVIAALNQPVYRHYIRTYWTEMVRHTNAETPDIDVYLPIEHGTPREPFAHLGDNVIEDPESDLGRLVAPKHQRPGVPVRGFSPHNVPRSTVCSVGSTGQRNTLVEHFCWGTEGPVRGFWPYFARGLTV